MFGWVTLKNQCSVDYRVVLSNIAGTGLSFVVFVACGIAALGRRVFLSSRIENRQLMWMSPGVPFWTYPFERVIPSSPCIANIFGIVGSQVLPAGPRIKSISFINLASVFQRAPSCYLSLKSDKVNPLKVFPSQSCSKIHTWKAQNWLSSRSVYSFRIFPNWRCQHVEDSRSHVHRVSSQKFWLKSNRQAGKSR